MPYQHAIAVASAVKFIKHLRRRLKLITWACCAWSAYTLNAAEDNSLTEQRTGEVVVLNAESAKIEGPNARLQGEGDKEIAWWTNVDTSLNWKAQVTKPGRYRVELNYCVIGNNNGSQLEVIVGNQTVRATPKVGKSFNDYRIGSAGQIDIREAGPVEVTIKPALKSHEFVINLRAISLIPAGVPSEAIDVSGDAIKPAEDGTFILAAQDAEIRGVHAQLEAFEPKNIGFWQDRDTTVSWPIDVSQPGEYRVEVEYSLTPNCEGSVLGIRVGDQEIRAKPPVGKNWADYHMGQAGKVTFATAGNQEVVLWPVSKPHDFFMNVRQVRLVPVGMPSSAVDIEYQPIHAASNGSYKLTTANAEIDGQTTRIEGGEKKYIVWWNDWQTVINWPVKVEKPGEYSIRITYSLGASNGSSDLKFVADSQKIEGKLEPSEGLDDFSTVKFGKVAFEKPGTFNMALTSPKDPGGLVMYLRSVSLNPTPE